MLRDRRILIRAISLALAACAAPAASPAPIAPTYPTPKRATLPSPSPVARGTQSTLRNLAFQLAEPEVEAEMTSEWINGEEAASHAVTGATPGYPTGVFDSPRLRPADSFRFTV
jgi:hypothetical protein